MKKLSYQKGITLLEQAVVFMVGIPLVLGVLDVSNIVRVNSALQKGVKSTLRCLYPSDAECVSKQIPDYKPVYKIKKGINAPMWPINYYEYSGKASWLGLPRFKYSNPEITVLDKVHYEIPRFPAFYNEPIYDVDINLRYNLLAAKTPYLDTSISALKPKFVFAKNYLKNYPAQIISINKIAGSNSKFNTIKPIGKAIFKVPDALDLPCYRSKNLDTSSFHTPNFSSKCSLKEVPVIIHITGNFPADVNAEGSKGTVLLKLTGKDFKINNAPSSIYYNLGGRAFTYDSSNSLEANFVPRGVPPGYYSHSHNYTEFTKYFSIKLKPGNTYTLHFFLKRLNQTAKKTRWQGGKLKIFYPQFSSRKEVVKCDNYSLSDNIASCHKANAYNQNLPQNLLLDINKPKIRGYKKVALGCMLKGTEGISFNYSDNTCTSIQYSSNCPYNRGVNGNPDLNINSAIECPIKGFAENLRYTEKTLPLSKISFNYTKNNCNASDTPPRDLYPPEVKGYKKIRWTKKERLSPEYFYTLDVPPYKFQKENSEYYCSDISYHEEPIVDSEKTTLYSGSHPENLTTCEWEKTLKQESEKLGFNKKAYFSLQRRYVGTEYSLLESGSECNSYLPQNILLDSTKISETLYSASEMKEVCSNISENEKCDYEFAGFKKQDFKRVRFDKDLAIDKGYQTIRAAYPGASLECDSKNSNCLNLDYDFDGEKFKAAASIKVPMLSLLGRKAIELRYAAENTWENIYE